MPRRLMTATEVSEYLGVAEQTLANWRYLGKGPGWFLVGSRVKYDAEAVDAWLDTCARSGDDRHDAAQRPGELSYGLTRE